MRSAGIRGRSPRWAQAPERSRRGSGGAVVAKRSAVRGHGGLTQGRAVGQHGTRASRGRNRPAHVARGECAPPVRRAARVRDPGRSQGRPGKCPRVAGSRTRRCSEQADRPRNERLRRGTRRRRRARGPVRGRRVRPARRAWRDVLNRTWPTTPSRGPRKEIVDAASCAALEDGRSALRRRGAVIVLDGPSPVRGRRGVVPPGGRARGGGSRREDHGTRGSSTTSAGRGDHAPYTRPPD